LKQGEKISNLVNASQNSYSFTFDYLQKTLKRISKNICKNKTCGASVVQNVKNKETIHAYFMGIYIGSIPSNLCTNIMQTSSNMHFYTCFGLCWHQSPKRGRLKGN
jgi:ADP-glucose pyrophosphorylase